MENISDADLGMILDGIEPDLDEVERQLTEGDSFKSRTRGTKPLSEKKIQLYVDGYEAGWEAALNAAYESLAE